MNVELEILKQLAMIGTTTVNERYLFNQVNLDSDEDPVTTEQIREALTGLKAKRQIVAILNEDRGTARNPYVFQITDSGKARAQQ